MKDNAPSGECHEVGAVCLEEVVEWSPSNHLWVHCSKLVLGTQRRSLRTHPSNNHAKGQVTCTGDASFHPGLSSCSVGGGSLEASRCFRKAERLPEGGSGCANGKEVEAKSPCKRRLAWVSWGQGIGKGWAEHQGSDLTVEMVETLCWRLGEVEVMRLFGDLFEPSAALLQDKFWPKGLKIFISTEKPTWEPKHSLYISW